MMFGGVKIKGDFYKNANLEGKYPSGKRITITVGESEDIKEIIEDLRNQLNKVWF